MKLSAIEETKVAEELCRLEFFTLHRGRLVRKVEAEREWYRAQGRAYGPVERSWADGRLLSLHQEFTAAGRRPKWVSFHPELAPALVATIASGRKVVIQVRSFFKGEEIFREAGCGSETLEHRFDQ